MIKVSWDYEMDRLKTEKQAAFERKQAAWQSWREASDRTDRAYDEMQRARQERNDARDEMNDAFEARQAAFERNNEIWDEYKRIKSDNNYQLEQLRREANYEHQAMIDCFEAARSAYESGDKTGASAYSSEGHDHKDRRNVLNAEVSALVQEIKDAKARAEYTATRIDSSVFERAKRRFESAKARCQTAEAEFRREKDERNRLKSEFDRSQAEFVRAKEALEARRKEVRAEREAERNKAECVVSSVTGHFAGKNAKVRQREDGMTDIFFSSGEHGDDLGHGHVVVDQNGSVRYARDEWQDKRKEYLIDDRREDHTKI